MLELLTDLGFDPTLVFGGLLLSALLIFGLYRRFIVSLFEPINMFLVGQVGDATVMLALPVALNYKWQFASYMVCLWAGFALCAKQIRSVPKIRFDQRSLFDLKFLLGFLGIAIILANLYLGATAGFPLLSSNPTDAKQTVYAGGLGLIRRLDMGPYTFFCAGCALLIVTNNSRRFAVSILALATSLVIFSGGKSVFLPLLFALTFAVSHKGICPSEAFRKKVKKTSFIILGAGLSVALIVTTKEHGGIGGGVQNFLLRLLLAGDVILYYYPRREIIKALVDANLLGFLQNAFADTMGLLRISQYSLPLGSLILGSEEGGPNVQYFIAADLFFRPIAGCMYSFVIGCCIAMFRNGFFHTRSNSAMVIAMRLFLALIAFDLATEAGMFVTEVFITLVCIAPLYVVASVCRTGLNTRRAIWLQLSPKEAQRTLPLS
ncbi:MAG: hypothetical protein JWM43_2969 [Acidobacteriaceae bacterium]|nr:hypothetical protein [Acidobacteriaceae bacterium]